MCFAGRSQARWMKMRWAEMCALRFIVGELVGGVKLAGEFVVEVKEAFGLCQLSKNCLQFAMLSDVVGARKSVRRMPWLSFTQ